MLRFIFRSIDHLAVPETAWAHCDIPCGIYNIHAATTAAETVYVMTEKLMALEQENHHDVGFHNTFTRMVTIKEEHAQLCKDELQMLWSDYFKPEHLEKVPDLHETIWHAVKLCSATKRGVDMEAAEELKKVVTKVGEYMELVR